MRKIYAFALFVSLLITSLTAAHAERRVALVIGNSAYQHTATLANPKNDAEAVSKSLERLGFEVLTGLDTDIHKMIGLVRDFSKALEGADVALFYYAGHGLQVDGHNYLAPVDAMLDDQADLDFGTVKLSSILQQMDRHRAANLVFLDACRDNPLAKTLARSLSVGRSATLGRGLARVEAGIGTLIAYATQPGNIALDGEDGHSPFTKALLNHIETPGLDISSLMIKVRQDVIASTAQKQVPWDHSSLTGQFYFKPADKKDEQQVAAVNPTETTQTQRTLAEPTTRAAETRLAAEQNAMELSFWETIKDSNDPDLLQTYLNRFPNGVYADLARVLIVRALKSNDPSKMASVPPGQADTQNQSDSSGPGQPESATPVETAAVDNTAVPPQAPAATTSPALQTANQQPPPGDSSPDAMQNTQPDSDDEPDRAKQDDDADQDEDTDKADANTDDADEDADTAELRNKALNGDRDAAVELARYYDQEGDSDKAADYALIATEKGGQDYADAFTDDTKAWTKDFWSAFQERLQEEGHYRGAIDGVPGRGTKAAVEIYAGVKVAVQTTHKPRLKKRLGPPPGPTRRKVGPPPGRGKPPPNKWCKIDPNWSRCTNQ